MARESTDIQPCCLITRCHPQTRTQRPWVMGWWVMAVWTATWALSLPAGAALPFAVESVSRQTFPQSYRFDGVVEPVNRTTVSSQTAGRIAEILVDVDQLVAKDAVIIRLHAKEHEARYAQAQADVREKQVRWQQAQDEFARIERLFQQSLVPKSEVEKAATQRDSAHAQWERAQAIVVEVQEQVKHTLIRAPYAGIVMERHVQVGETVQVGAPLMTGFALDPLRVVVMIPQNLINQVRAGAHARVYIPSQDAAVTVRDLTIFPNASDAHSFKVRIPLPKVSDRLYPGMLIKVDMVVGEYTTVRVPTRAVARRGEVTGVYVVEEGSGQIEFRFVRLGRTFGDVTEVLSGLVDGETIALDPGAALQSLKSVAVTP